MHGAAAAAGGVRGWALGSIAAGYVLSVVAMIYFLCRRVMWRKEQYGLKYQLAQVGPGGRVSICDWMDQLSVSPACCVTVPCGSCTLPGWPTGSCIPAVAWLAEGWAQEPARRSAATHGWPCASCLPRALPVWLALCACTEHGTSCLACSVLSTAPAAAVHCP